MAPSAISVEQNDVANLPLKLDGAKNGVKGKTHNNVQMMESEEKTQYVLRAYRTLIADLCQQFNMGHPGSAMGMAAIGIALWKYTMKYSPSNPDWFNRDRFILSNGHACLFQYTFLHLVGYKNITFEQLASYHSDRWDSYCPGHPEIEHPGVEVTTGPLGQGIANAVGLAMATKHLGAQYNRPGYDLVNNMTWVTIGDACLQEGVGMEAIQLAGHWRLDNLCVIYDNNNITCDGSADIAMSEDVNMKMRASGFEVLEVEDGNYDVESIVKALVAARGNKERPTFINIKTTIGIGSKKANQAAVHGAPLGNDDIKHIKETYGFDPNKTLQVPQEVYDFFREAIPRGQQLEAEWNQLLSQYNKAHPDVATEFERRRKGQFTAEDYLKFLPKKGDLPTEPTPSRKSVGTMMNPLAQNINNFMVGTADLTPSVNMAWKNKVDFQSPDVRPACGINGNYTGRYIHWGIREHAMASVSNGLAAYNRGTILPVTSSFFMFYIYAAPGVRMGALQSLQVIHIATHDSIGTGEDGPTHQPIELAALYRAMPNFLYIRPCDGEEAAGAVIAAVNAKETPSMISVARQNTEQYPQYSSRDGVQKGAYVFVEEQNADVTLLGVGAEMTFAVGAAQVLKEKYGIRARIVSFPCQRLFEQQSREYKKSILGTAPRVIIESYSVNGWERYADAGFSMHSFGHSLPREYIYGRFNFDNNKIAAKVQTVVEDARKHGIETFRGDFRDLNTDYVRDVFHSPFGTSHVPA